jgi:hypothetical protein
LGPCSFWYLFGRGVRKDLEPERTRLNGCQLTNRGIVRLRDPPWAAWSHTGCLEWIWRPWCPMMRGKSVEWSIAFPNLNQIERLFARMLRRWIMYEGALGALRRHCGYVDMSFPDDICRQPLMHVARGSLVPTLPLTRSEFGTGETYNTICISLTNARKERECWKAQLLSVLSIV